MKSDLKRLREKSIVRHNPNSKGWHYFRDENIDNYVIVIQILQGIIKEKPLSSLPLPPAEGVILASEPVIF